VQKSVHSPKQHILQGLLRRLRQEAGLRQSDLAERLNVQRTFISRVETGEVMLDFVQVEQYVAEFGLKLTEFTQLYENAVGR
jgi:transcriptional regulator with XRE-family HTH domain